MATIERAYTASPSQTPIYPEYLNMKVDEEAQTMTVTVRAPPKVIPVIGDGTDSQAGHYTEGATASITLPLQTFLDQFVGA